MIDYSIAISCLRPNEEWILNGEKYTGLTWLSDTPKPTEEEIIASWPDAQAAQKTAEEVIIKSKIDAVAHTRSLGFTDDMIKVMYPNLGVSQ